jgi:hypothetical protein
MIATRADRAGQRFAVSVTGKKGQTTASGIQALTAFFKPGAPTFHQVTPAGHASSSASSSSAGIHALHLTPPDACFMGTFFYFIFSVRVDHL